MSGSELGGLNLQAHLTLPRQKGFGRWPHIILRDCQHGIVGCHNGFGAPPSMDSISIRKYLTAATMRENESARSPISSSEYRRTAISRLPKLTFSATSFR